MRQYLILAAGLLSAALSCAASGDELAGLWTYRTLQKPGQESAPLAGIFLFHDGRFVHQAMHGGEPMDQQMTDAHVGTYRVKSVESMELHVEQGVVVTPAGDTLLAGRSDTCHEVGYALDGDVLRLRYANGSSEDLQRIGNSTVEFVQLDHGMLAFTDRHFVLVTQAGSRWVAGSGRYVLDGTRLEFEVLRWFEVEGEDVRYRADETIDAVYDGRVLSLPDGSRFEVLE